MAKRNVTYLTDAFLITCVVQKDLAEPILEAAKHAGAQGATISYRSRDWRQRKDGSSWRYCR